MEDVHEEVLGLADCDDDDSSTFGDDDDDVPIPRTLIATDEQGIQSDPDDPAPVNVTSVTDEVNENLFWRQSVEGSVDDQECHDATEAFILLVTSIQGEQLLTAPSLRRTEVWDRMAELFHRTFGVQIPGNSRRKRGSRANVKWNNLNKMLNKHLQNIGQTGASRKKTPRHFDIMFSKTKEHHHIQPPLILDSFSQDPIYPSTSHPTTSTHLPSSTSYPTTSTHLPSSSSHPTTSTHLQSSFSRPSTSTHLPSSSQPTTSTHLPSSSSSRPTTSTHLPSTSHPTTSTHLPSSTSRSSTSTHLPSSSTSHLPPETPSVFTQVRRTLKPDKMSTLIAHIDKKSSEMMDLLREGLQQNERARAEDAVMKQRFLSIADRLAVVEERRLEIDERDRRRRDGNSRKRRRSTSKSD